MNEDTRNVLAYLSDKIAVMKQIIQHAFLLILASSSCLEADASEIITTKL